MTDYKHTRYTRPAPPSELAGLLQGLLIVIATVAVLAWVDSMLFGYPVIGTF